MIISCDEVENILSFHGKSRIYLDNLYFEIDCTHLETEQNIRPPLHLRPCQKYALPESKIFQFRIFQSTQTIYVNQKLPTLSLFPTLRAISNLFISFFIHSVYQIIHVMCHVVRGLYQVPLFYNQDSLVHINVYIFANNIRVLSLVTLHIFLCQFHYVLYIKCFRVL